MKTSIFRIILTIVLSSLYSQVLLAQAPNKMSYQAVLRNANNVLATSQTVAMQISILQGSTSGPSVFTETHVLQTNSNGLINLKIGDGANVSGSISTVDWSNGPYFIQTETDLNGGTNYTITATTQFLSVPYALHANTASSLTEERSYLYLRKKATLQSIPHSMDMSIHHYDIVTSNNITLNNNTGEITFTKAGTYIISGLTSFNATTPGRRLIWFDCVSNNHPGRIASIENAANRISTSMVGYFNAGDHITFRVFQSTGQSVDSPNTSQVYDETQVNIEKIR